MSNSPGEMEGIESRLLMSWWTKVTFRFWEEALDEAILSETALMSTPTTFPVGPTALASGIARAPVPQARSRILG